MGLIPHMDRTHRGIPSPRVAWCALGCTLLLFSGCMGASGRSKGAELRPASGEEIMRMAHQPGARAVLVNVWATWCQPCREEFPDLVRIAREHRGDGLRVIFVSGDFTNEEPSVRRFLSERGVDFTTYLKTGKDMEFVNALDPSWSGSLPATWIYDAAGERRAFWWGKAPYDSLEKTIQEVLAPPKERSS